MQFIFTRKKEQRIIIGDDIKITVLEVRNDTVRLRIDLPNKSMEQSVKALGPISNDGAK